MLLRKPFQHVVAQSSATLGPVFTEVKTPSLIMGRATPGGTQRWGDQWSLLYTGEVLAHQSHFLEIPMTSFGHLEFSLSGKLKSGF